MTDTTTVDPDALLGEIMLTPEGKADPYPRYAAIREHAPAFRSELGGLVVMSRYEDCQSLLRDPRFGKGQPGPIWEQYDLSEEEWQERFGEFNKRTRSMLEPRPARSHPAAQARGQGVHPQDRRGAPAGDRPAHRRAPRPLRRRRRRDPRAGPPAADHRHRRDARRAAHRTRRLQPLVRAAVATLELHPTLEAMDAASAAAREIVARFEVLVA